MHRLSKTKHSLSLKPHFLPHLHSHKIFCKNRKGLKQFPVDVHQRTKKKQSFQARNVDNVDSEVLESIIVLCEASLVLLGEVDPPSLESLGPVAFLKYLPHSVGFLFYICAFFPKPEVLRKLGQLIISEMGNLHNVSDTY